MGSSLRLVDECPAGSIVGIGGLDDIVIKTGTISSTTACPNFVRLQAISMGLVKVVMNSKEISQMDLLKEGLIKLNRSDPSVQFGINKGQYILSTCGEIHLERCIKDLNDEFCPGVELQVSDPIIPFRETILNKTLTNRVIKNKKENFEEIDSDSESDGEEKKVDEMDVQELFEYEAKQEKIKEQLTYEKEQLKKEQQLDPYLEKLIEIKFMQGDEQMMSKMNENKGWAIDSTANKLCKLKIRAVGLDFEICKWIEKNLIGLRDSFEVSIQPNITNFNPKKLQNAK